MPRQPGYTEAQYKKVVSLLNKGKTIAEIQNATGLSMGLVNGIKRKASEEGLLTVQIKKRNAPQIQRIQYSATLDSVRELGISDNEEYCFQVARDNDTWIINLDPSYHGDDFFAAQEGYLKPLAYTECTDENGNPALRVSFVQGESLTIPVSILEEV